MGSIPLVREELQAPLRPTTSIQTSHICSVTLHDLCNVDVAAVGLFLLAYLLPSGLRHITHADKC